MVRMGLWVDVTSVFSLTAVQDEGGGFSHLRERKTEDEKEEERTTALSVHKCRSSDVTRQMCGAAAVQKGKTGIFRSLVSWEFIFHYSHLMELFLWNSFSVCVCHLCQDTVTLVGVFHN